MLRRAFALCAIAAALLAAAYGCRDGDGVSLEETGRGVGELRFSNGELTAVIQLSSFQLTLEDQDARVLAEELADRLQVVDNERHHALGSPTSFERDGKTLRLIFAGNKAKVNLTWLSDRTLEVAFTPSLGREGPVFSESYALRPDEAIYGLSERVQPPVEDAPLSIPPASELEPQEVGSLDRRGEVIDMMVRPTEAVYAPFYISSAGYGLYVEGTTPGTFDVGATDDDVLRFQFEPGTTPESQTLRYYLFAGDPATIVDEYTQLTGRPFVPPGWAFEHWRWRDELPVAEPAEVDGVEMNADVADDIAHYDDLGIPTGVYMIDRPWSPGDFGFHRFEWDPERLTNAEGMLDTLSDRGYKLALWTAAWAVGDEPGDNGAEAVAAGYRAPGSNRVIDLTNQAAWDWWRAKHVAFAKRYNVAAWKLDRGEEFIPSEADDIWADGRNGREIHNAYPNLQLQLMYEAMQEARPDDFVVMARTAYAGGQQYGIVWGGDTPGSTLLGAGPGTDLGLRNAIISMQRVGFMGFPIWGSDTGGYYEFKDREVFARWLQFSAFCPLMEIGGKGTHAPWDMPTEPNDDEELTDIYKTYVQLHHDLVPYTVEQGKRAGESGLPVARALVFDYPGDPEVRDRWDEYLYGDDLLVAPVWESGARSRRVYLPEGPWQDYWDRSKVFDGPTTITADAPLDRIPVFVRAGAEVPEAPGE